MGWGILLDILREYRGLRRQLSHMEHRLNRNHVEIQEKLSMAQADIDRLAVAVAKNTTVSDSAVTMITGLAQQIRDAADDPQELNALADQLESKAAALGEAIEANTAKPAPPADPPV